MYLKNALSQIPRAKENRDTENGSIIMDLTNNEYLYPHMKASAKGRNVLILSHMDYPVVRMDGKRVAYELELRWLSEDPSETGDEVCCVRGNEFSYWSKRELKELGALDPHSSLFDCFDVF